MKRALVAMGLLVAATVGLGVEAASAHPLGNFTINTYSGLRVGPDGVSVDFLVDMAEIPTLQRKGEIDRDAAYGEHACAGFVRELRLAVDGRGVALASTSSELSFRPGQAGLSTLRLECSAAAHSTVGTGARTIEFASGNFTDRAGWREVTAIGDGVTLVESNVAPQSTSERLTNYPNDLLSSPLNQRSASLVVRPGGAGAPAPAPVAGPAAGRARLVPRGIDRATATFTSFVARQNLTFGFALVALAASVGLGAAHAFAPGHGKTVMAAYLIGQRGSYRQALTIALTVTATHTLGVLALGIAIATSSLFAPERLYPWLGTTTGVLLIAVGVGLLVRLRRASHRHGHSHGHDHDHGHGDRDDHPHPHGRDRVETPVTRRGLVAMGFVGGLLPSPSAVVVLLGAIALGRAWFGVLLVVAYGLGMAGALAGAGLLMVRASSAVNRFLERRGEHQLVLAAARVLPAATAVVILATGLYLAARGAAQI